MSPTKCVFDSRATAFIGGGTSSPLPGRECSKTIEHCQESVLRLRIDPSLTSWADQTGQRIAQNDVGDLKVHVWEFTSQS